MNETISLVVQVVTAIAALAAILIAVMEGRRASLEGERASDRFREEQALAERIAAAQLKPVLHIHGRNFVNDKGIIMTNYGPGTAVVTNLSFTKAGTETRNLARLFKLISEHRFSWDNFWTFDKEGTYLKSGQERVLVALTAKHLVAQGVPEEEALNLLKQFASQRHGISVAVDYEDVLGNKQKSLVKDLSLTSSALFDD